MHSVVVIKVIILFCGTILKVINADGNAGSNSNSNAIPSLSENVDRHAVFTQPLTEGIYRFNVEGYIPQIPLERIRKIHKEMIKSIQAIANPKKQIQYILTLSNTANQDIEKLRKKMEDNEIYKATDIDKHNQRADAFVLLVSHAALMSNTILYFPDTMSIILKKNRDFDSNIRWVIQFTQKLDIINDEKMLKLFNLAMQEIGIIPKLPDYHNPYKTVNNYEYEKTYTTTKKPRKKLQRGPRMSAGEL